MVGIITDNLKRVLLDKLIADVQDAAEYYYIGIGNSIDWDSSDTAPTPINSLREERSLRLQLQSIKSAEDVSYVVPRNNWAAGSIYSGYDDNTAGHPTTPYFVLTDDNSVYICLKQGRDATGAAVASTIKPQGAATTAFYTSDGYTWKFLYTLSAGNANRFLSANYVPVQLQAATDSASSASEIEQYGIQQAAVSGQIGSIRIVSGGSGYSSAPAVTVTGDGDSCTATAIIYGGAVVDIKLDSNGSGVPKLGSGYTHASVSFSSGTATARAALSPTLGFGADSRKDLRAKAVMFNTKPNGSETGKFITDNDFRQIALIKNPLIPSTDSDFSQSAGLGLKSLSLSAVTTGFSPDNTIIGGSSGARAYVDTYSSNTIYYHQTETTGFTSFAGGEALTEADGAGAGTLDSASTFGLGDINFNTGEILYIENRAAIARATDQTEDLKIVIQL
jgi:hypothetical protein